MGLCSQYNTNNIQGCPPAPDRVHHSPRQEWKRLTLQMALPAISSTFHTPEGTAATSSSPQGRGGRTHWTRCIASQTSGGDPRALSCGPSWAAKFMQRWGRPGIHVRKWQEPSPDTALAPVLNRLHYKPMASASGYSRLQALINSGEYNNQRRIDSDKAAFI